MFTLSLFVFQFYIHYNGADYTMPTVTLESCLPLTASFTIANMTSGGLVYIRTDKAYNVLPTVDGNMEYSCSFEDCNIVLDEKFLLVVQEKPWIQTANDVMMSNICLKDLGGLFAVKFASSDQADDGNVTTVSYKADVAMDFYVDGNAVSSGSIVKLGTPMDIVINVTNNFQDFFDVNVKSCSLSMISLIENRCSVDEGVFGPFTRIESGHLTNTFSMLRPTTTTDEGVVVIFSCTLEVCSGECSVYPCNDTTDSDADTRRRREVTRRDTRDTPTPKYLGSMFTVVLEDIEKTVHRSEVPFCMPTLVFVTVIVGLSMLCIPSFLASLYFTKEFIESRKQTNDNEQKELSVSETSVPAIEGEGLQTISNNTINGEMNLVCNNENNKSIENANHNETLTDQVGITNEGYTDDVETSELNIRKDREHVKAKAESRSTRARLSVECIAKKVIEELNCKTLKLSGTPHGADTDARPYTQIGNLSPTVSDRFDNGKSERKSKVTQIRLSLKQKDCRYMYVRQDSKSSVHSE